MAKLIRIPMVPFAIRPGARKVPFLSVGERLVHVYPSMEVLLKQAHISLTAREYLGAVFFSAFLYFLLFSFASGFLLYYYNLEQYALYAVGISFFVPFTIYLYLLSYPRILVRSRLRAVDSNLISALRFALIQVKSGVSLFDTLRMVSEEDYGAVSDEFGKIVTQLNAGIPEEDALQESALSNPSPFYKKALWQISNGMKAGVDVARSIADVVSELEREESVEIHRYGSDLRLLSLIYLLLAIIMPVLAITFLIVLSTMSAFPITPALFVLLFLVFIAGEILFLTVLHSKKPELMEQ